MQNACVAPEETAEHEREEEEEADEEVEPDRGEEEGEDEDMTEVNTKDSARKKHTQEEIISKLLEDQISFSDVNRINIL